MKSELQNQLVKKYPEFFEYLKNYKGPIMPMSFGFSCGDGWYFIIDNLMSSIQFYMNNKNKQKIIKNIFLRWIFNRKRLIFRLLSYSKFGRKISTKILFEFSSKFEKIERNDIKVDLIQVKEKFGTLRFYIHGGDEYINGMISLAENMSYHTCEKCGTTENIGRTKGWISVLCEDCAKRLNKIDLWSKYEN